MRARRPLWRAPQQRVEAWRRHGASEYVCRALQFGVYDPPIKPFKPGNGGWLGEIPLTPEELAFGQTELDEGCQEGIYREVSRAHADRAVSQGSLISSSFVVGQGGEGEADRKGRLVINLSEQSEHWAKGTVKMESISEFACHLQRNDHMMSMDIKKGYRLVRLHPAMRDWFLFVFNGRVYQCIALPFGWGRSPLWFTQIMAPFARTLRSYGYRTLVYLDDFLLVPSPYVFLCTKEHCTKAQRRIDRLLATLGIERHPTKGCWEGATQLEHLGVVVDTVKMTFTVTPRKRKRVHKAARGILRAMRVSNRWIDTSTISSFCGTCVSLSLAMPWSRFYTRALYFDLSKHVRKFGTKLKCRLSHQSIRDLRFWVRLATVQDDGRPLHPMQPQAALHSDAADLGFGGTFNTERLDPGAAGMWCDQSVWDWRSRARSITLRELKAIRLLLSRQIGVRVREEEIQRLKIWCDNQAVVHIVNSMVSASAEMMVELRKLKTVLDSLGVRIRAE